MPLSKEPEQHVYSLIKLSLGVAQGPEYGSHKEWSAGLACQPLHLRLTFTHA